MLEILLLNIDVKHKAHARSLALRRKKPGSLHVQG